MTKSTIWTVETRAKLYREALRLCGPFRKWEGHDTPGRGLDDAYHQLTDAFAVVFGAKSGKAVRMQVSIARRYVSPKYATYISEAIGVATAVGLLNVDEAYQRHESINRKVTGLSAGKKAALTRKRRIAARKAAATRQANQEAIC
jgi:hypothetical protein